MRIIARKEWIGSWAGDVAGVQNLIGIRIGASNIVVEHVIQNKSIDRSHDAISSDHHRWRVELEIQSDVCTTIARYGRCSNSVVHVPVCS